MKEEYLSAVDLAKKYHYSNENKIRDMAKRNGIKYIRSSEKGKLRLYNVCDIENLIATNPHIVQGKHFTEVPIYNKFLTVKSENAIVVADFHVPFIDIEFFEKILKFSKKRKVSDLLSVGDFFDQDAFSYWYKEVDRIDWEDELNSAFKAVNNIQDCFKKSYYCMGSHDKRLARMLADKGKNISATFAYRELKTAHPEIEVTYHQKMILESGGRTYHLEHPKTVMRVGNVSPHRRQSSLGGSLVFAHGHKQGMERAWNGKDYIIALGMVGDPLKIHYHTIPSGYAEWDQGFLWVEDGKPTLIFKDEIDWWLKH